MSSLERLYWLHYEPARPLATLWDEWMVGPTLWPGVTTGNRARRLRDQWRRTLLGRFIDPEGYVASHQHASIAHQHGWPFPFWKQGGRGAWGWHFSLKGIPRGWHGTKQRDQKGWTLVGGEDRGIHDGAWNLQLRRPQATVETPPLRILPEQAPFLQLRWRAKGLRSTQPYIEWGTTKDREYGPDRRFYFAPPDREGQITYTMIPVFKSPAWKGEITRLRICFDNPAGAEVGIQALFTQYDTRHNVNNLAFIIGSDQYFRWTRDLDFLRRNINRMRLALLYVDTELGGREHHCVVTPFVGHDGRSAITYDAAGRKHVVPGRGIGNNYWDLLPMGYKDAYATIRYYHALNCMARLEDAIARHPEWNIPGGPLRRESADLRALAEQVQRTAGALFWNEATGRFVCSIDIDGRAHDYGFTFLNCEAICYGFATPQQARSIMSWLTGERIVAGDTAQGKDIYHWRFGPRATTKRNVTYYGFFWPAPEKIPWGGQVQDGGAVLGFSYHDLMARLRVYGPDNAREIIDWFDEVQAAGGYRAYYKDGTRGTLQGGGTPGGLGCDKEFYESILVPQIMIDGFLGFRPRYDGFEIHPRLPTDWPSLTVTDRASITIKPLKACAEPMKVYLPPGRWRMEQVDRAGRVTSGGEVDTTQAREGVTVRLEPGIRVRFVTG